MMTSLIHFAQFLKSGCIFLSSDSQKAWVGWSEAAVTRLAEPARSHLSIYAPDFFLKEKFPWWSFSKSCEIDRIHLQTQLETYLRSQELQTDWRPRVWMQPDYPFFQKRFQDLKQQFRLGLLKKAVPVVFETAEFEFDSHRRAHLLFQLLSSTRTLPLHIYGVWSDEEGILGATPELLFQKDSKGPLRTVALAGTRIKGDPRENEFPLIEDPKEREEHQWVIQGIQDSLSSIGKVSLGTTQVLELPTLRHLMTPIQVDTPTEIESHRFFEKCVKQLHPTPALGAYPRKEGLKWLEESEARINRLRFGAPFGLVSKEGSSQCVVGIRNLQWKGSSLFLGAGCGVIESSVLEREWNELRGKIHSVKKLFGLEV